MRKTVMFCWELGRGLGHILPMLPLAEDLARRGHRVFLALRHLSGAAAVFGRAGVSFLQAPYKCSGPCYYPRTVGFAHVLANAGWGHPLDLFGLASAWRNLFMQVRPDLLIFDHSPTALLASRCLPSVGRALLSPGFFCPPDAFPLPTLIAGATDQDRRRCADDEVRILRHVNRLLEKWGQPPLDRLGRLYGDVDQTFLTTFPELDHYGDRSVSGVRYWGHVDPGGGKDPQWPSPPGGVTDGSRVYAYLKPSPLLPALLRALTDGRHRTIVYADGIDADTRRRFGSTTLRFEDARLNLERVGAECDVGIHNANHGTLCNLLLHGKPVLQLPLTLEQKVLARAVERLGASETVAAGPKAADQEEEVRSKLQAVVTDPRYARSARAFADRHAGFNRATQRTEMFSEVTKLLESDEYRAPRRTASHEKVPAPPAGPVFSPAPGACGTVTELAAGVGGAGRARVQANRSITGLPLPSCVT